MKRGRERGTEDQFLPFPSPRKFRYWVGQGRDRKKGECPPIKWVALDHAWNVGTFTLKLEQFEILPAVGRGTRDESLAHGDCLFCDTVTGPARV